MVEPPTRPGRQGSLLALTVVGASSSLNLYSTQPLLPLLSATLGVAPVAAALTVSATGVAVALASPFAGLLADRLGRRRTIVAALFALVAPTLLAASARGIGELVAWRFLQGLVVPGIYAVGIAYATVEWRGNVGRAMAALMAGNVLGGFLGRLISATAAAQASWRAAFLALALVTLAGALAVRRWLPGGSDQPAPARAVPRPPEVPAGWRALLAPRLLATFLVGHCTLFTLSGTFTYVTFHLSGPPFRLGVTAIGWLFSVYLVGAGLLPFVGRWLDRFGSRRAVAVASAVAFLGGGLTLLPSVPAVTAGLALVCTAAFVANASATAYLAVAADGPLRSVAAGIYVSSYYLGGALGAVVPAFAWQRGGWPATLLLIGAVQLLAAGGAVLHWKARPAPRQAPAAAPPGPSGAAPPAGGRPR